MKNWFRWLFWRCMDCGAKLEPHPLTARGDVCKKCFEEFNGMTIEELMTDVSFRLVCVGCDAVVEGAENEYRSAKDGWRGLVKIRNADGVTQEGVCPACDEGRYL